MPFDPRSLNRRLSLFENVIVILLALALVTVVIDRAERLMADAEAAALTTTVSNINSAYYLLVAQLIIHDRLDRAEEYAGTNPFAQEGLLVSADRPEQGAPFELTFSAAAPNYAGHCTPAAELPPRHWCYDEQQRELHYRVEYTEALEGGEGTPPQLRFAVRLRYQDLDGNGRFEPRHDHFERLTLQPLTPYRWLPSS